ncbi:Bgt-461, partial [Blumeria graminis f. sp. tritici]
GPEKTGVLRRPSGNRSSIDEFKSECFDDETTVVEPDQGNVLTHIISQLRPGADLSRVGKDPLRYMFIDGTSSFMAHPEFLLPVPQIEDPVQRFVSVVKFYLSGWHIKPPGVKKPLNPILGETFTCYWQFPDNTKGYYISEQTSHHPPKSSYFYMAPEHHIRIDGCLKPRSKFLGNSVASMMEGIAILRFLNRGDNGKGERYIVTQPNMYARGILFGKMKYELGDHSYVRCPELGISADIEFKTKGYFSGAYNMIGGTIKNDISGEILYEITGLWSGEMTIKDTKRESQKLWHKTVQAVKECNHEVATDEKTKVEDMQRDEAAKRVENGEVWSPRLFRPTKENAGVCEEIEDQLDWILNACMQVLMEQIEQILAITPILPGQETCSNSPRAENCDENPCSFTTPDYSGISKQIGKIILDDSSHHSDLFVEPQTSDTKVNKT